MVWCGVILCKRLLSGNSTYILVIKCQLLYHFGTCIASLVFSVFCVFVVDAVVPFGQIVLLFAFESNAVYCLRFANVSRRNKIKANGFLV